jgi:hypothetical protein
METGITKKGVMPVFFWRLLCYVKACHKKLGKIRGQAGWAM